MLLILETKADQETLDKVAVDLGGYVKVVVDIEKEILTAGGKLHVDGEKMLLEDGSQQANLWGGGLDLETGEVDFESMINIRPRQGNSSRVVSSPEVCQKMEKIIRKLLR